MSSDPGKLGGSPSVVSDALKAVTGAEGLSWPSSSSTKLPDTWANATRAATAASEENGIYGSGSKAPTDALSKDKKSAKVENSPFVLYQPAWGTNGSTTSMALNGMGTLPSAIPTLPLPSSPFPGLNQKSLNGNGNSNNLAQAMRMLTNSYQNGGLVRFNNRIFGGTVKRFNRTPVACVVCHKAKSTCDSNRPCARCSRLGKAHLCKDRPHKKKGRPPKKRVASEMDNSANSKSKRKTTVKQEKKLGNSLLNSMFGGMNGGNGSSALNDLSAILRQPVKEEKNSEGRNSSSSGVPRDGSGTSFAKVAQSVDSYLWEEVIDDMSSFFIKHPEVLSNELAALYAGSNSRGTDTPFQTSVMDLPAGTQVLSPLFCMYLTYMSYYLNPAQFSDLQRRMAKKGVIIPNLTDDPIRKFDSSIAKTASKIRAIAPVFRFRWCRKKPISGITKELNFPMATLKVSFYRSSNPRTFLLFIRVNEEFEKVFGYKQDEVVRMSRKPFYYRLIHPKDWKKQLSLEMSMLLNKRRRFNTFIQCLCKWDEEICCLETFQFHFNNQDLMTHFTITFSPLPKYLFEQKDNQITGPSPPATSTSKPKINGASGSRKTR
mmetsp:Transcript_19979/g.29917  ORF Transcript_19979/g.29917 Transcript_19979/m.29917 type:complete len:601 (-) Transcript_19979:129-1931(-)